MNPTPLPIAEEDLHGFVDGEVDDERREAILAYLGHTPADAARVETWRQQNLLLKAAFAQVALEQVPPNLSFSFAPRLINLPSLTADAGIRALYANRRRRRSLVVALAAFAAGACVTLAADMSVNRYRMFAIDAFSNAPRGQGPALALLATAALRHTSDTQTAEANTENKAGAVEPALFILPSLRREGLKLMRGDVEGSASDPANCLDFADASGAPLVLCVAAAKAADEVDVQNLGAVSTNAVYWREGRSLYAIASPLRSERLVALARDIHTLLAARHVH
jgi:anti-sigma factor RsiW